MRATDRVLKDKRTSISLEVTHLCTYQAILIFGVGCLQAKSPGREDVEYWLWIRNIIMSWLRNYSFKFSFWFNMKRLNPLSSYSKEWDLPIRRDRPILDPGPARRLRKCQVCVPLSWAVFLTDFSALSITLPEASSSCSWGLYQFPKLKIIRTYLSSQKEKENHIRVFLGTPMQRKTIPFWSRAGPWQWMALSLHLCLGLFPPFCHYLPWHPLCDPKLQHGN